MMVYCELWWWFVNCDDGLLCLWNTIMSVTYNYACDLYCELWWFIVNWEGSVIRDILVKKGGIGRFAECNTRQRDALPSVEPKHSAKKPISVILGTFFASVLSLPSVFKWTLGKVTIKSTRCALVCRVYWAWHSAKCVNVAECFGLDTRQTLALYRVFWRWHSAKFTNFAECFGLDTR